MTTEQIAVLRVWAHALRDTDNDVAADALNAAIALAEQTCETCAHQKPGMKDWCQKVAVLCATVGNRCGARKAKEER